MLLVHPNIKVIHKLVRPQGGSVMPDCQLSSIASKWLTLPGFLLFAHLFGVAHFERIGGSLCSGLVAHYGADYSQQHKPNGQKQRQAFVKHSLRSRSRAISSKTFFRCS